MPGNYPKEIMPIERNALVTYKTITVANPAAGAEWSITVTATKIWEVLSISCQLITDATVATRRIVISFNDGTNEIFKVGSQGTQTASLTNFHSFAENINSSATHGAAVSTTMPKIVLPAGYKIETKSLSLQAGDQYALITLYVKEIALIT